MAKKTLTLMLATVALALAGCGTTPSPTVGAAPAAPTSGASLKHQVHTALEYYDSADLRAATLQACSATSEAEVDANMKLPACKAAMLADSRHQLGLGAPR